MTRRLFALALAYTLILGQALQAASIFYISPSSGSSGGTGAADDPFDNVNTALAAGGGGNIYEYFPGTSTTRIVNPPSGHVSTGTTIFRCNIPNTFNQCWINGGGSGPPIEISAAGRSNIHFQGYTLYNAGGNQGMVIRSPDDSPLASMNSSITAHMIASSGTDMTNNQANFQFSQIKNCTFTYLVSDGHGDRYGILAYAATNLYISTVIVRRSYTGSSANPSFAIANYNTQRTTWANIISIDGGPVNEAQVSDRGSLYVISNGAPGGSPVFLASQGSVFANQIHKGYNQTSGEITIVNEDGSNNNIYDNVVSHDGVIGFSIPNDADGAQFKRVSITSNTSIGLYLTINSVNETMESTFISSNTDNINGGITHTFSNVVPTDGTAGTGSVARQTYKPTNIRTESTSADFDAGAGGIPIGAQVTHWRNPDGTNGGKMYPIPLEGDIRTFMASIRSSQWITEGVTLSTYVIQSQKIFQAPADLFIGQSGGGGEEPPVDPGTPGVSKFFKGTLYLRGQGSLR